ncbi:hypothetical protein SEA_LIBERTYBELL_45 [Streptomyces phage LibertyBell]|nr:hypothetical protein SEA_LIBERTYBELL_45 [Streptomyces phage LibertyBell]
MFCRGPPAIFRMLILNDNPSLCCAHRLARFTRPILRPLPIGPLMKTLTNAQKRNVAYFAIFGLAGLALDKIKKYALAKADEMYPDENDEKKTSQGN